MASGSSTLPPSLDPEVNDFIPTHENSTHGERNGRPHKPSLALVPQASNSADGQADDGKPLRSAITLFASNIWSASSRSPARSAGLPPKPSWESLKSPAHQRKPTFTGSPHSFKSRVGLAVSAGGRGESRRGEDHRLDFRTSGPAVRYTQTEEYHNSSGTGGLVVKTDPLPQQPFASTGPRIAMSNNEGNLGIHHKSDAPKSITSARPAADVAAPICDAPRALVGNKSMQSALDSDEASTIQSGTLGDVWTERQHARCLRRALKDPNAEWEEAYEGALTVLAAVNPEHFRMPANSRVINIKTEYIDNLITSIRLGKYSVMGKVSERIMRVWSGRVNPSEKVLFLFSVNGSKKFSGLAEISGPWDPNSFIEGWAENSESHGCIGSFPVTWVYVKDVPYFHFTHIRQPGNEHPVGNMWNGMNFPAGTGRTVIQQYVETPATTSILGHPKIYGDNGQRDEGQNYSQRRGNLTSRGQRGARGSFRGGTINTSWRQHFSQHNRHESSQESHDDDDATPTPASRGRLSDTAQAPPVYKLSAAGEDTSQQANLGSVSFDASGKLVAVPPSVASFGKTSSTESFMRGSATSAITRKTQRENLPRLDVRRSKEYLYGGRQGDPMSAASSNRSTASASSKDCGLATSDSRGGLQHSASMSVLGPYTEPMVDDRPMLPSSASMHSLPAHTNYTFQRSLVPVHTSGSSRHERPWQQYDRTLPHRQDVAHIVQSGAQKEPSQPESLSDHLSQAASEMAFGPNATQHQLMAQYHMLQAEKFNLQHQLLALGASDMDRRYINAQIVRNGTELQSVEVEMSLGSSGSVQHQSPERTSIIQHGDSNSSSSGSGPNLSPIQAGQGSSSYSASLLSSPYSFPEGQDLHGPQRRAHGSQSSWDLRVHSIDDLVSFPKYAGCEQTTTMALEHASGSFPSHARDTVSGQANFSFHAPTTVKGHDAQLGGVRIDA